MNNSQVTEKEALRENWCNNSLKEIEKSKYIKHIVHYAFTELKTISQSYKIQLGYKTINNYTLIRELLVSQKGYIVLIEWIVSKFTTVGTAYRCNEKIELQEIKKEFRFSSIN